MGHVVTGRDAATLPIVRGDAEIENTVRNPGWMEDALELVIQGPAYSQEPAVR